MSRTCEYAVPVLLQRTPTVFPSMPAMLHPTWRLTFGGVMNTGIDRASAMEICTFGLGGAASGTSRRIRRYVACRVTSGGASREAQGFPLLQSKPRGTVPSDDQPTVRLRKPRP